MDGFPPRALDAIQASLERVRAGTLDGGPANLEEMAWLATFCELRERGLVESWLWAAGVCAEARVTRERSISARDRSRRLRTRARLRVIPGLDAAVR